MGDGTQYSDGIVTLGLVAPEKVGAGGMGEVFRARDTKLGREVALKTGWRARLRRMGKKASVRQSHQLSHGSVVF